MSSKISQTRSPQDTRTQFINWLIRKAKKDKSVWLLVGDLGFNFVERFQKEFPDRFLNVGIAEQNMIGIATGLAIMGKKVYCYSGTVFINYRCLEQIRSAWYQGLDVRVVGTSISSFLGDSHNFMRGEREPLIHLAKLLNKTYIRI